MAHELSTVSGEVEFASTRPAWHKLGTIVQAAMTAEQALRMAHLDWEVEQRTLHLPNGLELPDRKANVRVGREGEDVYLGCVSRHYETLQNTTAFQFMDTLVGRGEAAFETAGAIANGRKVFITAKLPEPMIVGERDDKTENYLVLVTAHDGSSSCRCLFSGIRIVCANTLRLALARAGDDCVSIRHSGDIKLKMVEADRILGSAKRHFHDVQQLFSRWRATAMDRSAAKSFFEELVPLEEDSGARARNRVERTRAEMLASFNHGPGADLAGSSMWGAWNAVAHWVDWTHRPGAPLESRFASTMYGAGQAVKQRTGELLMAYAS